MLFGDLCYFLDGHPCNSPNHSGYKVAIMRPVVVVVALFAPLRRLRTFCPAEQFARPTNAHLAPLAALQLLFVYDTVSSLKFPSLTVLTKSFKTGIEPVYAANSTVSLQCLNWHYKLCYNRSCDAA